MDFLKIKTKPQSKDKVLVVPEFIVGRTSDLMVRGGEFYAIWHEELGLWSTDPYDVIELIDREILKYAERVKEETELPVQAQTIASFDTNTWLRFRTYLAKMPDSYCPLDSQVTFKNTAVVKKSYVSKRLPYSLDAGETPAFDEMFGTLYNDHNLQKIMWAIGSIVSGDSKNIQKFFVLYGRPGTGKSTLINLVTSLFQGYYTVFDAKSLTGGLSAFATESFRNNPLVGINNDGDLSNIRDNTILNSIVGHDQIVINAKHQALFVMRSNAMLFIATNKPVAITDSNSGIIRRLIDIRPTGILLTHTRYDALVAKLEFELGAIAHKCLTVFKTLGTSYYDGYKSIDMMMRTNHVYNFIEEHRFDFKREEWITLNRLWALYKEYCDTVGIEKRLNRNVFRDELQNYWTELRDRTKIEGKYYRVVFFGFKEDLFLSTVEELTPREEAEPWLQLKTQPSALDTEMKDRPAQYASEKGTPILYWVDVTTKLSDLDVKKLHFYMPKDNYIVIDFDIKDEDGEKSLQLNLEAASKFPPTYAEVSKSGKGLHLHYIYDGDVSALDPLYADDIEVKVAVGNASIRRQRSLCNNMSIATISSGLPMRKRKKKMVSDHVIKTERTLRELILRNLRKEIHAATKPSIDFIDKILCDAYDSGMVYDVTDMMPRLLEFAVNSTNNSQYCIARVLKMPLVSKVESPEEAMDAVSKALTFYDVEVFPNLTIVRFKKEGVDQPILGMLNPKPHEIEGLFKHNLVGFNNRRYDNHILFALFLGYSPYEVYQVSKSIIDNESTAMFREAYNVSYTDVYDYSSKKQSLKKWEVELGLPHREFDWDWDTPLPEDLWVEAANYCDNDVLATEAVHNHLASDYQARLIIARLSGLSPNYSTASHTAAIILGPGNKNPQADFVYPDLSLEFPGYKFEVVPVTTAGKKKYVPTSTYMDEVVGEGGYVFAKPGFYTNVLYADVESMHPMSAIKMNIFGIHTKKYDDLRLMRVAIKKGNLKEAAKMFGGKLASFLEDPSLAKQLEYSLKIVINIVYGLTAAAFSNPFRDPRNKDNVVAKRGALFMVALKNRLEDAGINVVHIKTDSVKIANYTESDLELVKAIGAEYGYTFGVEGVYEKMLLINDAVLIGKWAPGSKKSGWDAVGARFAHPYVYKKLFTREPVVLEDLSETRNVQKGKIYLDMGPGDEDSSQLVHVGRVGRFYPVKESVDGGRLVRIDGEKRAAVTGTKGYRWLIDEVVENAEGMSLVDDSYFVEMLVEATNKIGEFCDINQLVDPVVE